MPCQTPRGTDKVMSPSMLERSVPSVLAGSRLVLALSGDQLAPLRLNQSMVAHLRPQIITLVLGILNLLLYPLSVSLSVHSAE
jgi:hypothetical protein